jgi:endonuclease/exonuclease/phosphatase family metal-dependent hydrolase
MRFLSSHALLLALLFIPCAASGKTVRIASFNVLQGVGSVGGTQYNAVKSILFRVDADLVAFQELTPSDASNWLALAAELGYGHTAEGTTSPLSGPRKVGYYSRWPILSTFQVKSTPPANEITRPPFRAVIDVDATQSPLVLWTVHHKASSGANNEFRRAIEGMRTVQNMDAYLLANPTHDEYVVLGDFNDDVAQSQTDQFTSLPSGLPGSYLLCTDVVYPVPYRVFPEDTYEIAGNGMTMLGATHEDSAAMNTFISGGRFDYIFVSPAIQNSPLGVPMTEVYNSNRDDGAGGLPKTGLPLAAGTSSTASDHFLLFADIQMANLSTGFSASFRLPVLLPPETRAARLLPRPGAIP